MTGKLTASKQVILLLRGSNKRGAQTVPMALFSRASEKISDA